ncbi:protein-tyrosine-phosphatase [Psychroflexus planctonicus]|uniref:Protein-tyrosine-phosphatase n=2 Tax=Psychroflexus planctonicus TaxID=1526575 RepID=A0ABQ1SNB8_9FLAO|nr:protein-tyrosine-phosphatase [Psychroflexus planctonicus]
MAVLNIFKMKKVLILCTGNSCRSQIAHGFLKTFLEGTAEVFSAGVETHGVNPKAIEVMKEENIDLSSHTSNHVDEYNNVEFDYIITVCDHAKEKCPLFIGKGERLHYNFPDPAKATGSDEEIMNEFRKVRDMIKQYSLDFTASKFV